MNISRNTTDVYKPYRHWLRNRSSYGPQISENWPRTTRATVPQLYLHVPWCSLCMFIKGVRMMFGFSHTAILMTSFQNFKVPVFREILPPSEQNRMIKTPSPNKKF